MRKTVRLLIPLPLIAALALAGCKAGAGYPGLGTPRAALETYFSSARKADYATTYDCYYRHYKDLVPEQDYVSHRSQASVLRSYAIESLSEKGGSAEATVALAFGPKKGTATDPSAVTVHEELVKENGAWRIKVW